MTERQPADTVAPVCHSEKRIHQAVYDTFFDHFDADDEDPDEIEAAEQFCREVLALLRPTHNDGEADG